jgi:WD40 repeat protein
MKTLRLLLIPGLLIAVPSLGSAAGPAPSYARDIRPFVAKYCLECHNPTQARSNLDLETYKSMAAGGKRGVVLVPGKPDESRLLLTLEGKNKPTMPPRKSRQPSPAEVQRLRAWIAAGAKDDTGTVTVRLPDIQPKVPVSAPVPALAYRPDGKLLATVGHREVLLLDATNGARLGKLSGLPDRVSALTFSRDGRRLAVADGAPGERGEVRLYLASAAGSFTDAPERVVPAHKDIIHALAFSPDGKLLATCSYDRLIKLWDVASGELVQTLKDHSDAVYGVAFNSDGQLLASAAADRAVKVWDVATGKRLYTLGDSTDWVYAVTWSPDGRHLTAAGIDKSIRIWEASAAGGKLLHSVFAHEGPVLRLAYAADGGTLYSLSEDRTIKAWDTVRMVERKVYPKQPEATLALAVRPDHQQLAVGRYDGVVQLLDEATGKLLAQPLPAKPKPPRLNKITPAFGQRGQTVRVTFEGKDLDEVTDVTSSGSSLAAKMLLDKRTATSVRVELTFPPTTVAGIYQLALKSPHGASASLPFTVDLFPLTSEQEPNDSPTTGQEIVLPATLAGSMNRAGDTDYFRFKASAGQQIGVQVMTTAIGSKLESIVQLIDPAGRTVAESPSGVLGHTCTAAGVYALGIRDRDFRGGAGMHYRLHVGPIPVVTAVFPLGLQRGTEAEIRLEGVQLGSNATVRVKAPSDAMLGSRLPVTVSTPLGPPLGNPSVLVDEFPEVVSPTEKLSVPGTANGRILRPGAVDTWHFSARKGQRLVVEVNARRIGSPFDSVIEILDTKGQPVPRATLRCLAKTYMTFRDHDSATPAIRLETWNELAINDYILVGSELLRIRAMPKNPDDNCEFFSDRGQRIGYLDTTPTHHAMNTPMYKVALHPPGTTFPPNGLPVVTLFYRNDDGGPGYGKDSRLFFDPPADGDYQVRIGDARGQGGLGYAYRLTVRPPRPSFTVRFNPTSPAVWKGGAVPVTVSTDRIDGFEGPIEVRLENLPHGFSAPATRIPAGENSTAFALSSEPTAMVPAKAPALKLTGRASIGGQEIVREAQGGNLKVVEPGDLMTRTAQSEVTVRPGQSVRLLVSIERRNGFKGRVPLDVRGLPHGVRVLDIGLNGILVTPQETSRSVEIYCEPWVEPTTQPFVVLSKREGKNTEHAAPSVLLRVVR